MRVGACEGVGMGGCGQTAKNDGESHCECCQSVRVLNEQTLCQLHVSALAPELISAKMHVSQSLNCP